MSKEEIVRSLNDPCIYAGSDHSINRRDVNVRDEKERGCRKEGSHTCVCRRWNRRRAAKEEEIGVSIGGCPVQWYERQRNELWFWFCTPKKLKEMMPSRRFKERKSQRRRWRKWCGRNHKNIPVYMIMERRKQIKQRKFSHTKQNPHVADMQHQQTQKKNRCHSCEKRVAHAKQPKWHLYMHQPLKKRHMTNSHAIVAEGAHVWKQSVVHAKLHKKHPPIYQPINKAHITWKHCCGAATKKKAKPSHKPPNTSQPNTKASSKAKPHYA